MTSHPQTQPHQRQKRENPTTQPDLDPTYRDPTRHNPTPYPHHHPTATSLPPVTAVEDHRRAPASTQNSLPSPKKPVQKRNHNKTDQHIFSPYFTRLTPTSPDFTRHDPTFSANHVPPFHHPYNSCLWLAPIVTPRTRPNPAKSPKKRKPPVILRRNPSKSVETRPTPRPTHAPNLCTIRTHRVHYPPSPPT